MMKWNDAWLSNKDCDGDDLLDRHYGFETPIGSGAWCTNHMSGTYDWDGNECQWIKFVKIVAVPNDAYYDDANDNEETDDDEMWYSVDGVEIGPAIWGSFAIIQEVDNDPCGGATGLKYLSPVGPGFGKFKP